VARGILRYLRRLNNGRLVLWCYLIWYLVVVVRYWDPSPRIWGTSLGLSLIIGVALLLNATRSGATIVRIPFWPAFRLFVMPFCVSSFAALVKDKCFVLVFSPNPWEVGIAAGLCAGLWIARSVARIIPEFRP
jgi:hypothetical protein